MNEVLTTTLKAVKLQHADGEKVFQSGGRLGYTLSFILRDVPAGGAPSRPW